MEYKKGPKDREQPASIIIILKIVLYWVEPIGNEIELYYDDKEKWFLRLLQARQSIDNLADRF